MESMEPWEVGLAVWWPGERDASINEQQQPPTESSTWRASATQSPKPRTYRCSGRRSMESMGALKSWLVAV